MGAHTGRGDHKSTPRQIHEQGTHVQGDEKDEGDNVDLFPGALEAVARAVNSSRVLLGGAAAVATSAPAPVARTEVARAAIAAGALPVRWGRDGAEQRAASGDGKRDVGGESSSSRNVVHSGKGDGDNRDEKGDVEEEMAPAGLGPLRRGGGARSRDDAKYYGVEEHAMASTLLPNGTGKRKDKDKNRDANLRDHDPFFSGRLDTGTKNSDGFHVTRTDSINIRCNDGADSSEFDSAPEAGGADVRCPPSFLPPPPRADCRDGHETLGIKRIASDADDGYGEAPGVASGVLTRVGGSSEGVRFIVNGGDTQDFKHAGEGITPLGYDSRRDGDGVDSFGKGAVRGESGVKSSGLRGGTVDCRRKSLDGSADGVTARHENAVERDGKSVPRTRSLVLLTTHQKKVQKQQHEQQEQQQQQRAGERRLRVDSERQQDVVPMCPLWRLRWPGR